MIIYRHRADKNALREGGTEMKSTFAEKPEAGVIGSLDSLAESHPNAAGILLMLLFGLIAHGILLGLAA